MTLTTPTPPLYGPHGQDGDRIAFARMCRRILYGEHEQDVLQRLKEQIEGVRREAWGRPDMGSNPYKSVWSSLATLYDAAPTVVGPDPTADGEAPIAPRLRGAGLWPLMSRVMRDVLGLREVLLYLDATADRGLTFEPVYPDMTCAVAAGPDHAVPTTIYRAELYRHTDSGELEWMWVETTVPPDGGPPVYRVLKQPEGKEGPEVFEDREWPDHWRYADGTPFLPYVVYHAAKTAYVYDPFQSRELVEGTLNIAVMRTYVQHVARSAAWRQRWAIDCLPAGLGAAGDSRNGETNTRQRVVTDPATIAIFQRIEGDTANPQLGTFDVPVIPAELWSYLEGYTRQLLLEAGVTPPDATRSSGDARSGYALAVDRDTQREAQRRFTPTFQRADSETVAKAAAMLNRLQGSDYAEGGYVVTYHGVPLSSQEQEAQRRHVLELTREGLMSRSEAYQQLHPGTTLEQARAALAGDEDGGDVQAAALTGTQIESLLAIVAQVAAGQLPAAAGRAVARVAFPSVPEVQIDELFRQLAGFTPPLDVGSTAKIDVTQVQQP